MSTSADEPLLPSPANSRWGRKAASVYLAVVALAFAFMLAELVRGAAGPGTLAVSILAAPWSVLLAPLARALHGRIGDGTLRAIGLVLVVLCALLNARIIYGIASRTERDAKGGKEA